MATQKLLRIFIRANEQIFHRKYEKKIVKIGLEILKDIFEMALSE